MDMYFITFRSVTLAQRGEASLRAGGVYTSLQRTPRWMEEQGCGYCLKLQTDEPWKAVKILEQGKIQYKKVYLQKSSGTVEVVSP